MSTTSETTSGPSLMERETREAPAVVERLLRANRAPCRTLAERLQAPPPSYAVTCARGSSDHAASYAQYLIEMRLGLPTASWPPSITSVYKTRPRMDGALFLAISQSGRSPDLVASANAARGAGAFVVSLTNQAASPLAEASDLCLPLHAGEEKSVAATKTFIASCAAALQVIAAWTGDRALEESLDRLPDFLAQAVERDWGAATDTFAAAANALVIARGHCLGIAQEAALKFKETGRLHAEAFSAAEVQHGPMALVREGFPVLAMVQDDASGAGTRQVIADLRAMGAKVFAADTGEAAADRLPLPEGLDAVTAPIAMIQSFYLLAEKVARARGLDPDHPPHLRKVTETL